MISGPVKLPGLSRNGPLERVILVMGNIVFQVKKKTKLSYALMRNVFVYSTFPTIIYKIATISLLLASTVTKNYVYILERLSIILLSLKTKLH